MFGKLLKIWLALFLCLCFVIGGLVKYPELTEVLEPVGGILLLLLVAYSLFLVLLFFAIIVHLLLMKLLLVYQLKLLQLLWLELCLMQ